MAANTRTCCIDASFVLSFLLPDEYNPKVDMMFNQYKAGLVKFISIPLLSFEVTSGLAIAIIRKRISQKYALERIEEFLDYGIEIYEVDFKKILELSQKNNLTAYDASYLYLAQKDNAKLLSLDEKLKSL